MEYCRQIILERPYFFSRYCFTYIPIFSFLSLPLVFNRNESRQIFCRPTQLVIDHFGFFLQDGVIDEEAWEQLVALAE